MDSRLWILPVNYQVQIFILTNKVILIYCVSKYLHKEGENEDERDYDADD